MNMVKLLVNILREQFVYVLNCIVCCLKSGELVAPSCLKRGLDYVSDQC